MRARFTLAFSLLVLLGCGGEKRPEGDLPELNPARGKVTRTGKPVAGGLIQFRAAEPVSQGNDLMITGAVDSDGSFELWTTHALSQKKGRGAPSGVYTATYLPPGESQDMMPTTLPTKVEIGATATELNLQLDGP